MKFKFRADAEDLSIFILFAIFLLYIVAISVANISSFAADGHLSGLNPLPAFEADHIFSTIVSTAKIGSASQNKYFIRISAGQILFRIVCSNGDECGRYFVVS